MDTRALYKRVLQDFPMSQAEFVEYYNDAVRELEARYGRRFVAQAGNDIRPVESLECESGVRDIYFSALLDGIIYLKTREGARRAESLAGAESAYRTVWREYVTGKRMRGASW